MLVREIVAPDGCPSSMVGEHVREVRAHLARMRRADNMLEAYALPRNAAGIKPSAELVKAKAAHAKAAEGILESMEALRTCRETDARKIACGANGIEAEEIFCSACGGFDSTDSNDILLCDLEGCNHAYHQQCVAPALTAADLEGEDWVCPVCAATLGLLDAVNEYCGEDWEDVASMFPKVRRRLAGEEVSSSEDDDEPDNDYVDSDRSSEPANSGSSSAQSESDADASDSESVPITALGPRRPRVDYAALAAELFGEDDDEDADPGRDRDFAPRRRKGTSRARPAAKPRRKRAASPPPASTPPSAKRRRGGGGAVPASDGDVDAGAKGRRSSPQKRAQAAPSVAVRRTSRLIKKRERSY